MRLVELILEGGNAFDDVGPVPKRFINGIIEQIQKLVNTKNAIEPIGSTGKKAISGDIDLAVDTNKINRNELVSKMEKEFGKGIKVGNDTVSFSVPYGGEKNAQVDLMFVPNMEFARFGYYSEEEGVSKYKGAIRNILLSAVATTIHQEGVDAFKFDEHGELIVRIGRTFDQNTGLRRIFGLKPPKKTGGYTKTMKATDLETIKKHHPDIEVSNDSLIIDNPSEIVEILFGEGTKPEDVSSAEKVLDLIKKKFKLDKQKEIFARAKARMIPLKNKMNIPDEIQ